MFQVAVPDLVESAANADILVFVLPHPARGRGGRTMLYDITFLQFVARTCETLKGKIKKGAIACSLIKV